ncbi:MAG: GntR family transcriptional regulator [Pseudomonadota bacterium]
MSAAPEHDPPDESADGTGPTRGELAYARLHDAIRAGTFSPGERMREIDIAARLGLGRTPVRDALRRLEAEGVIEHRPRIGAVVRRLDHAEIVELYEMRRVLERTAAEFAAQHATPVEIAEITDLNDSLLTHRDDPAVAARLNAILHRAIYSAGRNRFLMEAARGMANTLMLLGPTTLDDGARVEEVHAQHRAIITALAAHDAEAAGRAAVAHIDTSLRHRLRSLRE